MIVIETLKDYNNKDTFDEVIKLANEIYLITESINIDYPNYRDWYFKKHLPITLSSNSRNIIFAKNLDGNIIAMACLKKTVAERKICTLFVDKEYRGLGLGVQLVKYAINWLEIEKPFITFADYKLSMFIPLIKKYNWELTEIIDGIYNNEHKELCFNGSLTKKNNKEYKKTK